MRWTGLILSIAILGLTLSLFAKSVLDPSTSLTVRSAEVPAGIAAGGPLEG